MNFGVGELLVILVIVLVLFGATRLPALGAGLGKAIRGFKDATRDDGPRREEPRREEPGGDAPKRELPPDAGGTRP